MARRLGPWLAIGALSLGLVLLSSYQALVRYRELKSGWSWDLAYYNQWFWSITHGYREVTVRPASTYADEGPPVWKMNYLAPIRFALIPFYALYPDPRTLLVLHSLVFWLVIPAAFTLVRSETRSSLAALAAAALVPLTPLLWPLVWNDFRELQMVFPFVLWAIQGYRERNRRLAALGVLGMLACRQEYALVVASFAILQGREPEDIGRRYLWAQVSILVGLCWMLFAFFGYLSFAVASTAPELYIRQFLGPKAPLGQTLATALEFWVIGLGSWSVLALLAPRAAVLALPWLWSLSSGRWALRYLETEHWHHVRYTAPFVAVGLAAGLLGFANLTVWLRDRPGGRRWLAAAWLAALAGLAAADAAVQNRFARMQPPIPRREAAEIWQWIQRVGPDETVLAAYEVSAPLSSRRNLYSYVLRVNQPKGYPHLAPEFHWVFLRNGDVNPQVMLDQGFEVVYKGTAITIFRRGDRRTPFLPKK